MKVPFNQVFYTGEEMEYIKDALARRELTGDGFYTKQVSSLLEKKFGINKVLMTTSGTHALEMAAQLAGLKPGDEVIMPSFTFPSTANAVMKLGARPVFAEIKEDTLNIDPLDIERKITGKTRAIIPVHYAGIGCEMDRIMELAKMHGLMVIEDAAQAVNARYKDRFLGTWGDIGCYSFHGTKNYISGEGGAIAINSSNPIIIKKAEIIREKGTNKAQFLRGEVEKYSWVEQGSSYLPSDLLMAFLYAQLNQLEEIKSRRRIIHDYYTEQLKNYLDSGLIRGITTVPGDCDSNYHLFYLLFESEKIRDAVIFKLQRSGISAVIHYIPLHSSIMGRRLGYKAGDLPITEKVSNCLMRLPLYTGMKKEEMEYVVTKLREIFKEL